MRPLRAWGRPSGQRTLNLTLRVPSRDYGKIVDLVVSLGEVTSRREWTDDVTEQYIDLQIRIKNKQNHLEQLRRLNERSGSIEETLKLQAEIERATTELEQLEGRMRFLSDRVDFSTIIVNLYEPGAPAPIQPPKSVLERMKRGFIASFHSVVNFTGNLMVFFVSALPVMAFLTVVGALVHLAYQVIRRLWSCWRPGGGRPPSDGSPNE